MGGLEGGSIEQGQHEFEPWEKRVNAITRLLSDEKRKLLRVDELRRAIEDMAPDEYDEAGYYGRWAAAMSVLMIEKGIITIDELRAKLAEVQPENEELDK
jgi:hypothetical protein